MHLPYPPKPVEQDHRSKCMPGAWDNEPDVATWTMRINDMDIHCAVIRHGTLGHLCGYVGISTDAKLPPEGEYGYDFDVHGGVTYNNTHEGIRWVGFDCAHSGDVTPWRASAVNYYAETYRDFAYVMAETRKLARIVAESVLK